VMRGRQRRRYIKAFARIKEIDKPLFMVH
jgi:hypothetical protein